MCRDQPLDLLGYFLIGVVQPASRRRRAGVQKAKDKPSSGSRCYPGVM
jgi:hypothetical protein